MKIVTFILLQLFLVSVSSYATWSIIVIDPKTKEIGIAGASCTFSVYGIGGIIPGKGAIIVQAMSNKSAKKKGLQMLMANASPQEILQAIRDLRYDPEKQQYGIVCLKYPEQPLTYTGTATNESKGALTASGISVQGNTLADVNAIQAILNAALKAQQESLGIQEILMRALEEGAKWGGDKRCGSQKASSAFLTIAKPGDETDHPYLDLVVNGYNEGVNAVEALRKKFEKWKMTENNR
jgi:uncharacterized Ntn-hydrolase superfamily protein